MVPAISFKFRVEDSSENMDTAKITQIAHSSMAHRKTHVAREQGFIFHHGRRTAQIALGLADRLDCILNRDILYAAGLFHDIGKGEHPHSQAGMRITRELLGGILPSDELDRVCEIISCHSDRKRPNDYSLELQIVQDADVLDHVGPMNPWLSFYWSALHQLTIDDTLAYLGGEHLRERAVMRNVLNLDVSIRLFDERIEFESKFYAEFARVHRDGL